MRKFIIFSFFTGIILFSSQCARENLKINLKEDSRFVFGNKIVIPRDSLSLEFNGEEIELSYRNRKLHYQLDDINQDSDWDELVANLDAQEEDGTQKTNIQFGRSESRGGPIQTYDHFVLYKDKLPKNGGYNLQMDGVAWENDQLGFRHYLDGRNGRDIFGKRTPSMALDSVGLSDSLTQVDNYHVLENWGRDILSVGNSLGAGGIAILENDSLIRLGVTIRENEDNVDSTVFRIINEGPVRSIFALDFHGWDLGTRKVNLHQLVEIWPGDNYYSNRIWVDSQNPIDTVVIGLVNNNNDNPEVLVDSLDDYVILASHDKQSYNKEYFIGMALVVPRADFIRYSSDEDYNSTITDSYLILTKLEQGGSLKYHFHAGWGMQDEKFREKSYYLEELIGEFEKK